MIAIAVTKTVAFSPIIDQMGEITIIGFGYNRCRLRLKLASSRSRGNTTRVQDIVFQGTDPSTILNALSNRKPTDGILWPDLHAITVVAAQRAKVMHKKQTWTCIVKVVKNRVQLGHKISSIKLSSQIVECGGQRQWQWLRDPVVLTEC
jgi:hypothetical protein